jgi:hypothetical protein
MSDPASLYDKQIRWKQASLHKAQKQRVQLAEETASFAPNLIASQTVKEFDGPAVSEVKRSGSKV